MILKKPNQNLNLKQSITFMLAQDIMKLVWATLPHSYQSMGYLLTKGAKMQKIYFKMNVRILFTTLLLKIIYSWRELIIWLV